MSRRAQRAAQQQAAARARKRNRIITIVGAGILAAALVVGLGIGLNLHLQSQNQTTTAAAGSQGNAESLTVRDDSHRLADPAGSTVTFVEFLDFECEACRAAFPAIEQLRANYGDRVRFVVRYFPLDSHFNAMRAARAVEAAAKQGQFEAMYKKMYETQAEWGEQRVPKDDVFRQFAQQLGLDMVRWDADYASPTTVARIQADVADGTKLGITGTPGFFINGQQIEPKSYEDLTTAVEQALNRR